MSDLSAFHPPEGSPLENLWRADFEPGDEGFDGAAEFDGGALEIDDMLAPEPDRDGRLGADGRAGDAGTGGEGALPASGDKPPVEPPKAPGTEAAEPEETPGERTYRQFDEHNVAPPTEEEIAAMHEREASVAWLGFVLDPAVDYRHLRRLGQNSSSRTVRNKSSARREYAGHPR